MIILYCCVKHVFIYIYYYYRTVGLGCIIQELAQLLYTTAHMCQRGANKNTLACINGFTVVPAIQNFAGPLVV